MVFGLVISGFEVIKKIEGLKTDSASRPYADVRVIDCGQLITKSANDGKLVPVCVRDKLGILAADLAPVTMLSELVFT